MRTMRAAVTPVDLLIGGPIGGVLQDDVMARATRCRTTVKWDRAIAAEETHCR